MAGKEPEEKALMGRLMADLQRAAALGLIPAEGAQISARGEFIVSPSNVEEIEDRKRVRKYKEFPKTLHAWPEGQDAPVDLVVNNRAEEENAVALGWSADPVHGPGGRLVAGAAVEEAAAPVEVRTFAAPGQLQPHDSAGTQTGTKDAPKPPAKIKAPKPPAKSKSK